MTEQQILRGPRALPNVEALGVRWRPLWTLLKKQQRIFRQSHEHGAACETLRKEVERLEVAANDQLTYSILRGQQIEDASSKLPAKREELQRAQQKAQAYQRALDEVHKEIQATVEEHAESWAGEVEAKARDQLLEVEAAARGLEQLAAGMLLLGSLRGWLDNPKRSFSMGKPNRMRVHLEAILDEAAASEALPQPEQDPGSYGIQHPGGGVPGPVDEFYAKRLYGP